MSTLFRGSEAVTLEVAYRAAVRFLEAYWERGGKQDEQIVILLGSMIQQADGTPLDPAQWNDFLDAVDVVTGMPSSDSGTQH